MHEVKRIKMISLGTLEMLNTLISYCAVVVVR